MSIKSEPAEESSTKQDYKFEYKKSIKRFYNQIHF